jgi:hypothetical protein
MYVRFFEAACDLSCAPKFGEISRILFASIIFLGTGTGSAFAGDPPPDPHLYFFSMRAPEVDLAPRYVAASRTPTEGNVAALEACDGQTYYLTVADAAAVRAAIANANTVQLQAADPGADAGQSGVVCLMQASN